MAKSKIEKLFGEDFDERVFKAKIGDYVMLKHSKVKQVIGYAIGDDGRPCYVTSHGRDAYGWQTYLIPTEDVECKWEKVEL